MIDPLKLEDDDDMDNVNSEVRPVDLSRDGEIYVTFEGYIYRTTINKDGHATLTIIIDREFVKTVIPAISDLHQVMLNWQVSPPEMPEIDEALRRLLEETDDWLNDD